MTFNVADSPKYEKFCVKILKTHLRFEQLKVRLVISEPALLDRDFLKAYAFMLIKFIKSSF